MEIRQCNTCGGVYRTTLPNGMAYYHACPLVEHPDSHEWVPHPQQRNENIVGHDAKGNALIIAEGTGYTLVDEHDDVAQKLIGARVELPANYRDAINEARKAKHVVEPGTGRVHRSRRNGRAAAAKPAAGHLRRGSKRVGKHR